MTGTGQAPRSLPSLNIQQSLQITPLDLGACILAEFFADRFQDFAGALHVDFAAPGDAVLAATGAASTGRLRGTSFAAPLVAGAGALADAEAAFREAVKRDPGQLGALFFLGEAALTRGDVAGARVLWTPLMNALDPADPRRTDLATRLARAEASRAAGAGR